MPDTYKHLVYFLRKVKMAATVVELHTQSSNSCGGTTTSSGVLGSSPLAPRSGRVVTFRVGVDVRFGVLEVR